MSAPRAPCDEATWRTGHLREDATDCARAERVGAIQGRAWHFARLPLSAITLSHVVLAHTHACRYSLVLP
jgi:hypothetical protein